jgi:hypothetical protein
MVMEVKRIVVDELPESCNKCQFCHVLDYVGKRLCFLVQKEVPEKEYNKKRLDICSLQVEDECVYTGEYGGYDEYGDAVFFSKKTTCSDKHVQKISVPNNTFCPNCGRPIKYKEE